jgi:hypothetical protein
VVRIPIEAVSGGDTIVRLRADWLTFQSGSGLMVESFVPATIALRFEPASTATLPLSIRTRNELPADLALAQVLGLTPQVVRVRGPSRVMETLDSIPLEALDLSEVRESGIIRVRVDASGYDNLAFVPASAQLAVRLERAVARQVDSVPVLIEASSATEAMAFIVEPLVVGVTLRGAPIPVSMVREVSAEVAARDVEGLLPGAERTVALRLRGLPGLVSGVVTPDSVRVRGVSLLGGPDTLVARPGGP